MCLDDANIDTHPELRSDSVVKANGEIESMNPLNGTHIATAGENKAGDAALQQSPVIPAVMPPQPQQQQFQVTMPPGAICGQQLQVPSPDGQLIQFTVPAVAPGTVISVPYTPLGSQ